MARLFGTDGVRGVANTELTPLLAMQLGAAGATVLSQERSYRPTIMVGCDTRISGDMLANALMAGVCSVGANAVYVGVMPTPAIAYLTRKYKVDAGVVISASLNLFTVSSGVIKSLGIASSGWSMPRRARFSTATTSSDEMRSPYDEPIIL